MKASEGATGSRRNSSGLSRDVEILELLGSAESFRVGGLGVSHIADRTGRDKAVVSRALATLADSGIVQRDETTRRYLPHTALRARQHLQQTQDCCTPHAITYDA